MTRRYFMKVVYDGTAFHGSQIQGTTPTVQLELNKAVEILLQEPVTTFGASRTDEGVHAKANYYHFDTGKELHPQFHYRMNAILPPSISIIQTFKCIGEPINARFDAISREYRYKIYHKKNPFYLNRALFFPFTINQNLLLQTAAIILDNHNFESFAKRNAQNHTFLCNIFTSHWEEQEDQLHYVVRANRFLRGMVRGLVGTQLQVAKGKISLTDFKNIIEAKDCTKADFSVAGHGLYLEDIQYPEGSLIALSDSSF